MYLRIAEFEGHVDQIDYAEGVVHRLHAVDRDGQRLLITIRPPSEPMGPLGARASGPLVFLREEQRPTITIERQGP